MAPEPLGVFCLMGFGIVISFVLLLTGIVACTLFPNDTNTLIRQLSHRYSITSISLIEGTQPKLCDLIDKPYEAFFAASSNFHSSYFLLPTSYFYEHIACSFITLFSIL